MTDLVIACGALARELRTLLDQHGGAVHLRCLPADLHNRPQSIAARLDALLARLHAQYDSVFVAYADCGSGGEIDRVLGAYPGVERLAGAHCYDAFAGIDCVQALMDEQPGTFFLTDFMVRHFERLVIRGLGLDRHPELRDQYFGNYRRVVYLAQTDDLGLQRQARECATRLRLDYEYRFTGYGALRRVQLLPVREVA